MNKYQKYVKEDFEQPKNKKEIDSTKPLSEILEEIATSTTTTTTTSSEVNIFDQLFSRIFYHENM